MIGVHTGGEYALINDAHRELDIRKTTEIPVDGRSKRGVKNKVALLPKRVQLAHILQGAEAEILRLCISIVPDLVMLAHDGFACRSEVDVDPLAREVLARTGYSVTFSQERL